VSKVPVAVLGATGNIGQRFVSLLQDHPTFEIAALASSERKVGGSLKAFWRLDDVPLAPHVASMELQPLDLGVLRKHDVVAAFSGLPSEIAGDIEMDAARVGVRVFSNASAHRMDPDVPLLVPEVNPNHLRLVERQPAFREGGFVVTNPNCSITGLALPLKPLVDSLDLTDVHVATYQALSGAGYPGVPSLDITANVIPFIEGEEEKMRREAKKILGSLSDGILPSPIDVWANCARVAVRDGHLEAVDSPEGRNSRGRNRASPLLVPRRSAGSAAPDGPEPAGVRPRGSEPTAAAARPHGGRTCAGARDGRNHRPDPRRGTRRSLFRSIAQHDSRRRGRERAQRGVRTPERVP